MIPLSRLQQYLLTYSGHPLKVATAIFVICLTLLGISIVGIEKADRTRRHSSFIVQSEDISASLERRSTLFVGMLKSGASLFGAVPNMNRNLFRRYIHGLDLEGVNHGIVGIGWAASVRAGQDSQLTKYMIDQGSDGYQVWPIDSASKANQFPIVFLEPENQENRRVMGFNLFSEAGRRRAMIAAALTGRPAATNYLQLAQDFHLSGKGGFLIFIPVYQNALSSGLGPERGALRGFVYGVFRTREFVRASIPLKEGIAFRIRDGSDAQSPTIFTWGNVPPNTAFVSTSANIVDRKWIVEVYMPHSGGLTTLTIQMLSIGILVSLLLAVLAYLIVESDRMTKLVINQREEQQSIRNALTRELTHRVKNSMATILSIAKLTKRNAKSVDSYVADLVGRVKALSATHDLLTSENWSHADIASVLDAELAPYENLDGLKCVRMGPKLWLAPHIAISFGLAVHELATNAAKYGALSNEGGSVQIDWTDLGNNYAQFQWREVNGPLVSPPQHRGFGSDLLQKLTAHEFKSDVQMQFHPEGLTCRFKLPILQDQTT